MAAMAVAALVAMVGATSVRAALEESRISSVEGQARKIQSSFDSFYNDNNEYPAAPAGNDAETMYNYFFGTDSTPGQGALTQYYTLPGANLQESIFVPVAYVRAGSNASPEYELVVEVKNVTRNQKYVHLTRGRVSRSASSATTVGGS